MAAINFPSNPTNGQLLVVGTVTYSYNSTYGTWDLVTTGTAVVEYIHPFFF